jgi:ubiquinone/menaquinone biosynthesis C-methylase UbiE
MSPMGPTGGVKGAVAQTFDDASTSYDTIGPEYFGRFGRRLVEIAEIEPGMRVLDVGCGAGAALVPAARAVGPEGHVLGIDISSGMVERARAALAKQRLTNAEVRSGDAEIPGVGPGDRDRILAAQVLFFLPNLNQALRAYKHILRPGGVLAISSWGPDEKRWQEVHKAMYARIPEGAAPELRPSAEAFRNDKTIATTLEDAGFVDVRSVTEQYDITFDNADQWLSWSRSHAGRAYWDAIPAPERAQARNDAIRALQPLAAPDGRLTAVTTVRYTLATRP